MKELFMKVWSGFKDTKREVNQLQEATKQLPPGGDLQREVRDRTGMWSDLQSAGGRTPDRSLDL